MKKIILSVIVLFATIMSFAQSLDDINDMMGKFQYREAKAGIDKYLSNSKKATEAEAWFYKGTIYNALSHDSTTPQNELFDLESEAFNAYKKNQLLDAKDIRLTFEMHIPFLDLYYQFNNLAIRNFNDKNYDEALLSFLKSNEVKNYTLEKKYEFQQVKLYPLDTTLILNIATSAIQAKKETVAIEYYKKLIDARVAGNDYISVYQFVVDYYIKNDDDASLKEILSIAKSVYPGDDYWFDAELKAVSKKGDKAMLFAKYEELLLQNPSNFGLSYNYAVELHNCLYGKDATNSGDATISNKLIEVAKKAVNNEDKTDILATSLLARHLYYMWAELLRSSELIKSTKPDELKRKSELKAVAFKQMEECIIYSGNIISFYEALTDKIKIQKARYEIALEYLIDIYEYKKNTTKVAEYKKKKTALEKL